MTDRARCQPGLELNTVVTRKGTVLTTKGSGIASERQCLTCSNSVKRRPFFTLDLRSPAIGSATACGGGGDRGGGGGGGGGGCSCGRGGGRSGDCGGDCGPAHLITSGTKEMGQPCLICPHAISLVAQSGGGGALYEADR